MKEARVWQYRLRTERGSWLADILIREDGFFSTVSDWGNYAYWWRGFGEGDFRRFLITLNGEYVAEKLESGHSYYNPEKTLRRVKERLLRERREGGLAKEEARREWTLLASLLGAGFTLTKPEFRRATEMSEFAFGKWCEETALHDAAASAFYGASRWVQGFVEHVLPRFQEALRAELAAETAPKPESPKGQDAGRAWTVDSTAPTEHPVRVVPNCFNCRDTGRMSLPCICDWAKRRDCPACNDVWGYCGCPAGSALSTKDAGMNANALHSVCAEVLERTTKAFINRGVTQRDLHAVIAMADSVFASHPDLAPVFRVVPVIDMVEGSMSLYLCRR